MLEKLIEGHKQGINPVKYLILSDFGVHLVSDSGSTDDRYRYTAIKDEEICICINSKVYSYKVYTLNLPITKKTFYNTLLNIDYYKALFNNAICIGDSMTEGYRSVTYTDKNKSYPEFLSKLSGWNVTNAGISGITASKWYAQEYSKYNFIDYDVCFIMLGQNKTISDTDENTAYLNIINGILTQNNKIKIFLIPSGKDESKSAIKEIAQNKNLPVLDLDANTWFNLNLDRLYHYSTLGTWYDVHYNTIGYLTLAKTIFALMNQYISEHEEEYWDY